MHLDVSEGEALLSLYQSLSILGLAFKWVPVEEEEEDDDDDDICNLQIEEYLRRICSIQGGEGEGEATNAAVTV
jgi:hypothetical protein